MYPSNRDKLITRTAIHLTRSIIENSTPQEMSIAAGGFNPAVALVSRMEHHPADRFTEVTFLWGTIVYFDDRDHACVTEPSGPHRPMTWYPRSTIYDSSWIIRPSTIRE